MVPLTKAKAMDVAKLIETVERSQMPLVDEADFFYHIKAKNRGGEQLSREELDNLVKLVEKAMEWEKSVQSSAATEPDETLAG